MAPIAQKACKTQRQKIYLAWTRWSSSHSNSNQQATQGLTINPTINPNFEFDKLVVVPKV